jgi:SH2 domain-containing protein 4A
MLQQILSDMFIDPDLLAELDEEQKQILFCKIREEQVRRYKEREAQEAEERKKRNQKPEERRPKVGFLHGADGQPWTWVMGEHPTDKTIEQILEEEAQEGARRQAEKEAELLRRQQEEELQRLKEMQIKLDSETKSNKQKTDAADVRSQPPHLSQSTATDKLQQTQQPSDSPVLRRQKAKELEALTRRRSTELYQKIKLVQQKSIEQAEHEGIQITEAWEEQERKAKEAEQEKRLLARRAREDHHRAMRRLKTESQIINTFVFSQGEMPGKPLPGVKSCPQGRPYRPATKDDVIRWYKEVEQPKGAGLDPVTKQTATYFYGMISREEAEAHLNDKPIGTFLIRLSDRVWGYAVSYRGEQRCKHYLIDASDGRYRFFGTNQLVHVSLHNLIENHKNIPVSIVGKEVLVSPCGQRGHMVDPATLQPIPERETSYL